MNKMKLIYNNMWNNALKAINNDEIEYDHLLDDPKDLRRGITLLIKPDKALINFFNKFIKEAETLEPGQYFYNMDEIHVTILSLINCYEGFNLSKLNLPDYIECVNRSIKHIEPFEIEFVGTTTSPSCVLVQGFLQTDILENLRNNLRNEFKKSSLFNSIDKRYKIETAHCTLIRFKEKLVNKNKFFDFLLSNRDKYFGKTLITEMELVFTDWYHKKEIVQILQTFKF